MLFLSFMDAFKHDQREDTKRSHKNIKQISSGMIQIQKTTPNTSAVAEESLCDHSEAGTGEGTATMASSLDNGDIKFIQVEELNVQRARRLVGVGFVLCAVAVSVAVFCFAKKSDQRAFEVEVRKTLQQLFIRFISR
jgi:hypothetical protein